MSESLTQDGRKLVEGHSSRCGGLSFADRCFKKREQVAGGKVGVFWKINECVGYSGGPPESEHVIN